MTTGTTTTTTKRTAAAAARNQQPRNVTCSSTRIRTSSSESDSNSNSNNHDSVFSSHHHHHPSPLARFGYWLRSKGTPPHALPASSPGSASASASSSSSRSESSLESDGLMFDMDMDDNEEEEEDGEDIVVAASVGMSGLMMASSPPVLPTLSPTPPAVSSTQVVAETPLGDGGLTFLWRDRQVCLDDMEKSGPHHHQHQHQKTRPSSSSSVGDGDLPRDANTDAHFAPFLREEKKEEEEATTTRVRQLRQSRNALVETLERSTAHVNRLQARLLVYAGDKSALTEELGRARVEREEAMVGLWGRNRGGGHGAGFVTWGAVRDVTVFLVMGIGVLYSFWLWVNEPDFGYIRRRRVEVLCE